MEKAAWRTFALACAVLALAIVIYVISSTQGDRLARGTFSTQTAPLEIIIGNDVLSIPENMFRHAEQRTPGVHPRADLHVFWPDRVGFSDALIEQFVSTDPQNVALVMIAIAPRRSVLDMVDRFDPVYKKAFVDGSQRTLNKELTAVDLDPALGYVDEELVFTGAAINTIRPQFVARCQKEMTGQEGLLLPCETDLFVGTSLEIRVRFPRAMLGEPIKFRDDLLSFLDDLITSDPS